MEDHCAEKEPFRTRHYQVTIDGVDKFWIKRERALSEVWSRYLVHSGIVMGVILAMTLTVSGYLSSNRHTYQLIVDEDFLQFDTNVWHHEVESGGYLSGSFDWTTNSENNSWVSTAGLHIYPTLSDAYSNGTSINLTMTGECTGGTDPSCFMQESMGTMINPVKSARIRSASSITFGKVEPSVP